jgi:DNA-directed RNA polymerase-5 subunit 1
VGQHFLEEKSYHFDGDCIHLFYPQSLAARAEVFKLFSVEKEWLSSHSSNLNSQLLTDSPSSLKTMWLAFWTEPMLSN